jgi:protease PrsW
MNLLYILTFAPPILILFYIVKSDKFPEPLQCIMWAFFTGCFLCIPAGFLNDILIPNMEYSFIAGLTEESLKFLAFMLLVSKKIQFNERMDALVYGAAISIGFATYENYTYVFLLGYEDPLYIALLRIVSAIPMHAMCGIIMGYYLGLHFYTKKNNMLLKALFIPMLVHGIYNFSTGFGGLWYLFLFVIFFQIKKLHNEFISDQLFKTSEYERKKR